MQTRAAGSGGVEEQRGGGGGGAGAHEGLAVVAVGHDDVPVATLAEVLGGVQAEAAGGARDDDGLLVVCGGGHDGRREGARSDGGACAQGAAVTRGRRYRRRVAAWERSRGVGGCVSAKICSDRHL